VFQEVIRKVAVKRGIKTNTKVGIRARKLNREDKLAFSYNACQSGKARYSPTTVENGIPIKKVLAK
jgi:hypothetical protein